MRLRLVKIFSRSRDHVRSFVEFVKSQSFDVAVVDSYEEAIKADVVLTTINFQMPFLRASYLRGSST